MDLYHAESFDDLASNSNSSSSGTLSLNSEKKPAYQELCKGT
jgi:hypothetical protein